MDLLFFFRGPSANVLLIWSKEWTQHTQKTFEEGNLSANIEHTANAFAIWLINNDHWSIWFCCIYEHWFKY